MCPQRPFQSSYGLIDIMKYMTKAFYSHSLRLWFTIARAFCHRKCTLSNNRVGNSARLEKGNPVPYGSSLFYPFFNEAWKIQTFISKQTAAAGPHFLLILGKAAPVLKLLCICMELTHYLPNRNLLEVHNFVLRLVWLGDFGLKQRRGNECEWIRE